MTQWIDQGFAGRSVRDRNMRCRCRWRWHLRQLHPRDLASATNDAVSVTLSRIVVSVNCQRQISHSKTSGEQLNFTCSVNA